MQVQLAGLTTRFAQLKLRPVVYTASLAAAAVGAFYLFSRWRDDKRRTDQEMETPATTCRIHEEVMKIAGVGLAVALDCITDVTENIVTRGTFEEDTRFCDVTKTEELNSQNGQLLPFVFSPRYCGPLVAVKQMNTENEPQPKCLCDIIYCDPLVMLMVQNALKEHLFPSVYRPVDCSPWMPITIYRSVLSTGESERSSPEDQAPHFEHTTGQYPSEVDCTDVARCFSMSRFIRLNETTFSYVKYHHLDLIRGAMSQRWWISTREYLTLNSEDPPECFGIVQDVTCIKRFRGQFLRATSYRREAVSVTKTFLGGKRKEVKRSYNIISFGLDGVMESEEHEETISIPTEPRDTPSPPPGFAPRPPPGFAPRPPPGFAPRPPPGFAPGRPPGFSPTTPAGFAPDSPPGFASGPPPGFSPGSAPGSVPQSPPGFVLRTPPRFTPGPPPGFTAGPTHSTSPLPGFPPAPPPGFVPNSDAGFTPQPPPRFASRTPPGFPSGPPPGFAARPSPDSSTSPVPGPASGSPTGPVPGPAPGSPTGPVLGPTSRPFTGAAGPECIFAGLPVETIEVPSIYLYSQSLGIQDFPRRVSGLREAFNILMMDRQNQNFASVAMRVVLSRLASLNGMDQRQFQQIYDNLMVFVQTPDNHRGIQAELAEIGIFHFSVLDVVFELVLFGILGLTRLLLITTEGGFLSQLMLTLLCVMPVNGVWQRGADRFMQTVQGEMYAFLQSIFTMDASVYCNSQTLAARVWSLLEHHSDQLMSRLDTV